MACAACGPCCGSCCGPCYGSCCGYNTQPSCETTYNCDYGPRPQIRPLEIEHNPMPCPVDCRLDEPICCSPMFPPPPLFPPGQDSTSCGPRQPPGPCCPSFCPPSCLPPCGDCDGKIIRCKPKVTCTKECPRQPCCPSKKKNECPVINWPDPPKIDMCCSTTCPHRTIDICYLKVCPVPARCCPANRPCVTKSTMGQCCNYPTWPSTDRVRR